MRIAVIDLGTNSTRLLVADVDGGGLRELERTTRVTRLGEGVDASGRLAEAAVERVLAAAADYRAAIDRLGAEEVVALATSAARDTGGGAELAGALAERHGIEMRTISGDEEARLTFLGATQGRRAGQPALVLDIGGGSTELVVGRPAAEPSFHVSTALGSVRQSERHLRDDPPAQAQLNALRDEVGRTIAEGVPAGLRSSTAQGIAVAGTATSLAAIDQALEPYDSSRVHGHVLTLAACERMLARLAALALERRRAVPGLHPDRAPTIVAGAVILVEAMRAFGLSRIEVSEADILHGAALSAWRAAEPGSAPGSE